MGLLTWFLNSKYTNTKFGVGGWDMSEMDDMPKEPLLAPVRHVYPRKLDFRDMCLQASDQDKTPHCAGYSTAGFIEIANWRKTHYPEQIDGDAIYVEAKKIDGHPDTNGTWIRFACQAAINLKLIEGRIGRVGRNIDDIKAAIHQCGACIGGFNITNEWNMVNNKGIIRNLGSQAISKGGHAVLICGYSPEGVYIQNSWGTKWGLYGFALLSWEQVQRQFMGGRVIV